MHLNIVEISPIIYAGAHYHQNVLSAGCRLTDTGYLPIEIPCGGISYLFSVLRDLPEGHTICVGDRYPSVKKGMDAVYKNTRKSNKGITVQKMVCERILEDCGIQVYFRDGYESDDCVYSLCQAYARSMDKVYVVTSDMDLAINVTKNVTLWPAHSKAKTVTFDNFDVTTGVPYNAIALYKTVYGDKSDDIPPALPATICPQVYHQLISSPSIKYGASRAVCDDLISRFPEHVVSRLKRNLDLVFPLDTDVPELTSDVNQDRFAIWAAYLGSRRAIKGIKETQRERTLVTSWAEELGLCE